MEKRTWVYTQPPIAYGIPAHECGNADIQWSEFKKHFWCKECKVDFIPEHYGVFDGPIPLRIANMLGIRFDRFDFETKRIITQEEILGIT